MALTDQQHMRQLLGEEIPVGGSAADTLFTDEEIEDLLVDSTPHGAKGAGWEIKAAKLSHLVNITEGSTNRMMSQAFEHAMRMVQLYGGAGVGRGNARIHIISRD